MHCDSLGLHFPACALSYLKVITPRRLWGRAVLFLPGQSTYSSGKSTILEYSSQSGTVAGSSSTNSLSLNVVSLSSGVLGARLLHIFSGFLALVSDSSWHGQHLKLPLLSNRASYMMCAYVALSKNFSSKSGLKSPPSVAPGHGATQNYVAWPESIAVYPWCSVGSNSTQEWQ